MHWRAECWLIGTLNIQRLVRHPECACVLYLELRVIVCGRDCVDVLLVAVLVMMMYELVRSALGIASVDSHSTVTLISDTPMANATSSVGRLSSVCLEFVVVRF